MFSKTTMREKIMKINKSILSKILFLSGMFVASISFATNATKYKIVEIQKYLLSDKYQIGFCDTDRSSCNAQTQFDWVDNNSNITANNFYFAMREKNNPSIWFTIKSTKTKNTNAFSRSEFERIAIWYLDIIDETSLPTECIPNTKINVAAVFNSYGDEAPAVDQTEVICQ